MRFLKRIFPRRVVELLRWRCKTVYSVEVKATLAGGHIIVKEERRFKSSKTIWSRRLSD